MLLCSSFDINIKYFISSKVLEYKFNFGNIISNGVCDKYGFYNQWIIQLFVTKCLSDGNLN